MAFVVKHDTWLKAEADRVAAIIQTPRFWGVKWTPNKLRKALADIGLEYSADQIEQITKEMNTRGIAEDVAD